MAFPTNFASKAHVLAPALGKTSASAVVEGFERAFYDSDVEVVNRGPDFLEFKVGIEDRLTRAFPHPFTRRPPWTFALISGGMLSVTEQAGVYRVSAALRTSTIPLLRLLPFAVGALVIPVPGVFARLGAGIGVGLVFNATTYLVAKWQFGQWLEQTGSKITADLTRAA